MFRTSLSKPQIHEKPDAVYIIESVDSISRDDVDTSVHVIHYKKPKISN